MQISFRRLDSTEERCDFDCGDEDLNDFFLNDSKNGSSELMSVTYAVEIEDKVKAYFCVSNDSIRKEDSTRSGIERLLRFVPRNKRYSSLPAVKIGRLATSKEFQSTGIGTKVLDIIKLLFTDKNKTGCRFLIVDAMNNERTIRFYKNNGFSILKASNDRNDSTVLMFFDLITFKS